MPLVPRLFSYWVRKNTLLFQFCLISYVFEDELRRIRGKIITRVTRASIRFVAPKSTGSSSAIEEDFESAKSASQIAVVSFNMVVLLVWSLDFRFEYALPKSIYGLCLTGTASLLLASVNVRESRDEFNDNEDEYYNNINNAVLRGLSFFILGIGFFMQVIGILLPDDLPHQFVSIAIYTSNVLLLFSYVSSFLVLFGIIEFLRMLEPYAIAGMCFILLLFAIKSYFGAIAVIWFITSSLLLLSIAVVLYSIFEMIRMGRSIVDKTRPLPFER